MILLLLYIYLLSVNAGDTGDVFGLCMNDIILPSNATMRCDPPNTLPQICTLVCPDGYYSSGTKDIACADSICHGTCMKQNYTYNATFLEYAERECTYTRFIACNTTASGLCLETVVEPCKTSYYTTKEANDCKTVPIAPPDCWNSGCMGSCSTDGTIRYHYYSKSCPSSCKPWRDNPSPQFTCTKCSEPRRLENTVMEYITPSQIRYVCPSGYWGAPSGITYCMTMDGSWYPPQAAPLCNECVYPDIIGDVAGYHTVTVGDGKIEVGCAAGYVGETVTMTCSNIDGSWTKAEYPECLLWSPSATPSISATHSASPVSNSVSPSSSRIATPSVSKTPRAPKMRGSRAPSLAPKFIFA